jgi:hypothetical protein
MFLVDIQKPLTYEFSNTLKLLSSGKGMDRRAWPLDSSGM